MPTLPSNRCILGLRWPRGKRQNQVQHLAVIAPSVRTCVPALVPAHVLCIGSHMSVKWLCHWWSSLDTSPPTLHTHTGWLPQFLYNLLTWSKIACSSVVSQPSSQPVSLPAVQADKAPLWCTFICRWHVLVATTVWLPQFVGRSSLNLPL